MAYKSINGLMDNLKADLEQRYNVKCRMFPIEDLCEGCGEIKLVVDYVIWEEDE